MAQIRTKRARTVTAVARPVRPVRKRSYKNIATEYGAMKEIDDRDLVKKSQGGDHLAFEELVNRYRERLFWVAYNMVGNREEARDISQETFVRVFKAIDKYNPKYKFYTWAYQIATNISIDHLRRRGLAKMVSFEALSSESYKVDFPSDDPPVGDNLERRELLDRIRTILDKLPVKYKKVLVLRDLEGLHCRDIAKVMKCSYPTLRWRLFQARKLFKEAWEREFELENDFQKQIRRPLRKGR